MYNCMQYICYTLELDAMIDYEFTVYSDMVGPLLKENVMQSVALPTATPVTMLMSTVHFLVTVILAHIILKYARQSTDASNVGLCALAGLMQVSTLR